MCRHLLLDEPKSFELSAFGIIFESTKALKVTVSLASLPKSALPVTLSNDETVELVNVPVGAVTVCPEGKVTSPVKVASP